MKRLVSVCAVLAAAILAGMVVPPISAADSGQASLDRIEKLTDRRWDVYVRSPAMEETVKLQVIRPQNTAVPRSTLYLLNGAGAGVDGANWMKETDIVRYFADKNVNVVIPIGGYAAYYTDWRRDDPVLGHNKWQTFLTEELPPIVNKVLGTTGVNAIGGLSMSASSVLDLAIHAPGLYRGVASMSGCAMTSDPIGQAMVRVVVENRAGGNTANMWGPPNDPEWRLHDPYVNAERLRGLTLYFSVSSGLPGPHEMPGSPQPPDAPPLADQIVIGGTIEAGASYCTARMQERLAALRIPATFDFRPTGTHSWMYWQDALRGAWRTLAPVLT